MIIYKVIKYNMVVDVFERDSEDEARKYFNLKYPKGYRLFKLDTTASVFSDDFRRVICEK